MKYLDCFCCEIRRLKEKVLNPDEELLVQVAVTCSAEDARAVVLKVVKIFMINTSEENRRIH